MQRLIELIPKISYLMEQTRLKVKISFEFVFLILKCSDMWMESMRVP